MRFGPTFPLFTVRNYRRRSSVHCPVWCHYSQPDYGTQPVRNWPTPLSPFRPNMLCGTPPAQQISISIYANQWIVNVNCMFKGTSSFLPARKFLHLAFALIDVSVASTDGVPWHFFRAFQRAVHFVQSIQAEGNWYLIYVSSGIPLIIIIIKVNVDIYGLK